MIVRSKRLEQATDPNIAVRPVNRALKGVHLTALRCIDQETIIVSLIIIRKQRYISGDLFLCSLKVVSSSASSCSCFWDSFCFISYGFAYE